MGAYGPLVEKSMKHEGEIIVYAQGYEKRYGKNGFMLLVPAPQNLKTGEPNQSAIAIINIEKYD